MYRLLYVGYVLLAASSWAMGQTIWSAVPGESVDLASLPPVIRGPVIQSLPPEALPPLVVLPVGGTRLVWPVLGSDIPPPGTQAPVVLPPPIPPGHERMDSVVLYPPMVSPPRRLGVEVVDHPPQGARVVGVWLDAPASRVRDPQTGAYFRLEPGDVILAVNGFAVQSAAHLAQLVYSSPQQMSLRVWDCRTGRISTLLTDLGTHGVLQPLSISFPGKTVAALRRRAEQARHISQPPQGEGWQRNHTDPMQLLAVFTTLRLQDGYRLVGYERDWGIGCSGRVVAVPVQAGFPAPDPVTGLPAHVPGLVEDPMRVIQGDGSAWSYLEASILWRELREFGAWWHGMTWSTHTILGANPLRVPSAHTIPPQRSQHQADFGKGELPQPGDTRWVWLEPQMNLPTAQWDPVVYITPNLIRVVFYTYSPLGQEGIYRHEDTYRPGCYQPQSTRMTKIAEGPRYMVMVF